jgi:excisionase family DNA binding protein
VELIPYGSAYLQVTEDELATIKARGLAPAPNVPQHSPDSPERWLNVEQLSQLTSLPESWLSQKAREGEIPSIQCGKYVRFKLSEVETALMSVRQSGRRSAATY